MKPTKKQLKEIQEIEKKVASVCDNTDEIFDEISGQEQNITLKELLALCFADVDIFLLKDESQENDNDKLYTKEEIRNQLESTMYKMTNLPFINSSLYDIDLFGALGHQLLINSGFSKKHIKSLEKNK
jgi:uncharacterized protein YjgD (DUF1641 family)